MSKAEQLATLALKLASDWPQFFEILGPGVGDRATSAYMNELNSQAFRHFEEDFSQKCISGNNGLSVDFYFPDEATVIEIAMGLRNPNSEFERDILKAIMAQEAHNPVTRLLFLTKPGGIAKANSPSARAIIAWAQQKHGLTVEVREFAIVAENIIDDPV
jgi:hypothetical protein